MTCLVNFADIVLLWYNVHMTKITIDDVQHLADLSSLRLADDEAKSLQGDLERIIKYIEQLGELDTTGVEPTYQVTGLENVWRDDEISEGVSREDLLDLAPDSQDNQVKVPKVL